MDQKDELRIQEILESMRCKGADANKHLVGAHTECSRSLREEGEITQDELSSMRRHIRMVNSELDKLLDEMYELEQRLNP